MNPPRGMRDILPADKARRERVLSVIRERYRAHGFDEIETPVVEDYDRLHAGIGGDNEKLSYNILRRGLDAGRGEVGRVEIDEAAELALRLAEHARRALHPQARLVKTIGDAVMASFGDPANAVKAALAMQKAIADHDLVLKLGVHMGPSVVVTLNDRLDYFGSTVNMAARLQGQSAGGDIVLSRAVADDPAVQSVLAKIPMREEQVELKGFTHPVSFVRTLPHN